MAKSYQLHQTQQIPQNIRDTFAFFENAANLQQITPPSLQFQILTPLPVQMQSSALIDYRLKLLGFPFHWQTEITNYSPPHSFVDEQRRGPYQHWVHRHEFCETSQGTQMVDRVDYGIGWGPMGRLAHPLFVKRMLRTIFAYRREQIARLLS
ncbi:MAG: SRPBCC family protein [Planctomycetaceae bacterium]|nr:SRPBCC family protein [Planctomycetaceae bacterium]